jgi:hypothetical protein
MPAQDREWLLAHLEDQASNLATMMRRAREDPQDDDTLLRVRDEVFTIRETLDTLGVPHALVANVDWRRAIGTSRS